MVPFQRIKIKEFTSPRATRGASVMTPEVAAQAQQLLGVGRSPREVAQELGLKVDTLCKVIQQGRLIKPSPPQPEESVPEQATGGYGEDDRLPR